MYMDIPHGIKSRWWKDIILKLLKKLYSQKQVGRVWSEYLVSVLIWIGFKQSAVYEFFFFI